MAERIKEHPILGVQEKGAPVKFTFEPRGIFGAIGRCTDCGMVVDGVPNVRTGITPLKAGMDVRTQYGVSEKPFAEQ